jgi:hypothetical protein
VHYYPADAPSQIGGASPFPALRGDTVIEEKLTVGKLITPVKPTWNFGLPAVGSFFAQPSNHLSLPQTTKVKGLGKRSTMVAAMDMQPNRNFRWLTYYKGVITTMALGGMDILTGDMSGCWVMVYAEGMEYRVAHVGTDLYNPAATVAVKQSWNAFAQANPQRILAGFDPSGAWTNQAPAQLDGEFGAKMWALVTPKFELYSIYLYEQGGYAEHIFRVAGIKKIVSANTHTLSHI